MEAVAAQYSAENHRQPLSISPYTNKQIRSPRNRAHRSVNLPAAPRPSESFTPASNAYGGLLRSNSYQPPLLPLPLIPQKYTSSNPPPTSAKPKRLPRHNSLNPSKPLIRRQGSLGLAHHVSDGTGVFPPGSKPLGPDPNELPKEISISKAPNPSSLLAPPEPGKFFSSVFELAPPPSSLPLPKFSLRPKMACNAEAGVDSGATDGLRRILRLP